MTSPVGRPIADYGFISDCSSAALISGTGSIDWLCFPRFDSPSVFGRILDPAAGYWSIEPVEEFDVRRRYLEGPLVLETQFTTQSGMVMLSDSLLFGADERGHEIGHDSPHVLVRMIEATEGRVEVMAEFCPRPEYGLVRPRLAVIDGGLVTLGGADVLILAGPAPTQIGGGVAGWRQALEAGDRLVFALSHSTRVVPEPPVCQTSRRAGACTRAAGC